MSLNDEAVKLYGDAAKNWSAFRTYIHMHPVQVMLIAFAAGLAIGRIAGWTHFPF